MPYTYRKASAGWRAILDDVKDGTGLQSDNNAYTAIEGVLRVFRHRLTVAQGLEFANVLPAVPRAIFVSHWDPSAAPLPWLDRAALLAEVKALRHHHNLAPHNAIEAVARAIWRIVRHDSLQAALAKLPPAAQDYWTVPDADPADLAARFV